MAFQEMKAVDTGGAKMTKREEIDKLAGLTRKLWDLLFLN